MRAQWLVGIVSLAACDVGMSAGVGATRTTSVSVRTDVVPAEKAITDITAARCDREISCNHVGHVRMWESAGTCAEDARQVMRGYLIGERCAHGIDAYALSSCIHDIQNELCGPPRVGVEQLAACQNVRLCR